jgi:hypothetical protein
MELTADESIISRYKSLTPEDVKASTALLNPNEPGSTRLKLTWIWQTTATQRLGLQFNNVSSTGVNTDAGRNIGAGGNIRAGSMAGPSDDGFSSLTECGYRSST